MELEYRDKAALQSAVTVSFPKISNYKASDDYFLSKHHTRRNKVKIEDFIKRNAAIDHHFSIKKLLDVERRLEDRKKLAAEQKRTLDQQWEDLRKKEDDLRENFIFFSKFVQENIGKKERARDKMSRMKKMLDTRLQQIQETTSECQKMKGIKKFLDGNIIRMKIYEEFLARVVQHFPSQFTGIVDVLNRYESLLHAQQELARKQEKSMQLLETTRHNCDKLVADKYVEIACLKTKLSDIERRYEAARSNCQKWENVHHFVILEAQKKLIETEAVKDSCWQIYKHICDRKGIPTTHKDDYPKQFELIKKDLLQRKLVNEKIAEIEKERMRLSEKACASSETD